MLGKGWLAVVLTAAVTMTAAPAAADAPRVRKDAAALTATEKHDLVDALHALKRADYPGDDDPDGIRWFDQIVAWHVALAPCDQIALGRPAMWGHGGPIFLPWHRQYLLVVEDALRRVSGKRIAIPYWDWTRQASTDAVLADDLMGGTGNAANGYRLERGPFRFDRWPLNIDNSALAAYALMNTRWITRNLGSPMQPELPVAADAASALAKPVYDVAPWGFSSDASQSFRKALEGFHDQDTPLFGQVSHGVQHCGGDLNGQGPIIPWPQTSKLHDQVHQWVGGITGYGPDGGSLFGTMNVNLASPNDPIFFLHHANVDRLWAQWQRAHPDDPYRPGGGSTGETFPLNEIDSAMHPFEATPRDVADSTSLGVTYAAPGATRARVTTALKRGATSRKLRRLCRLPRS